MNYEFIGRYRKSLMGLAICMILITHSTILFSNEVIDKVYFLFQHFCQMGVDIFLFLSGFGLFFSLHKNKNLKQFYRKRFLRIFPEYVLVFTAFGLFAVLIEKRGLITYLQQYSLISFFTKGDLHEWFVSAILFLYLIAPLIFNLVDKGYFIPLCITEEIVAIICSVFFIKARMNALGTVFSIFIIRIPTFILGMFCAKVSLSDKPQKKYLCSKVILFIWLCLVVLLFLNASKVDDFTQLISRIIYLPLSFVTISLAINLIIKCENFNVIKSFSWMGGITFELYLVHEKVLYIYTLFFEDSLSCVTYILLAFASICISIFLAFGLSKINNALIRRKNNDS